MYKTLIGAILGANLALAMPAIAADPVALVEEVSGTAAGVALLDYLPTGSVIDLTGGGSLVVDYLQSCMRETITGGTVTIGIDHSLITGGAVQRQKVECDGGQLRLSTDQAAKSGVVVFRKAKPPRDASAGALGIDQTLYSASPLIDLRGGGRLVIERLDQPGERIELDIPPGQLLRGTFYDFAKAGRALAPGGVYRVEAGERSLVVKIDPFATAGPGPLAGRLLRL